MTSSELRENRKIYGLTQVQLAELMAVSPNTVARWERGEVPIQQGLCRLAFRVLELERNKRSGQ
ncbi:MAG: helix-turn-helix domain-containing protein [Dehalococcoidia bacterium]|nr:helix-turn-helix domain-containing protein [Dehalococcoidia bacterium]